MLHVNLQNRTQETNGEAGIRSNDNIANMVYNLQ